MKGLATIINPNRLVDARGPRRLPDRIVPEPSWLGSTRFCAVFFVKADFLGGTVRNTPIIPNRMTLFRSAWIEALTVISLRTFLTIWAIVLVSAFYAIALRAPSVWWWALVGIGALCWTFTEYALHRFVFHLKSSSPILQEMLFIIHGNHHTTPNDPLRNLMPAIVSLPLAMLVGSASVIAAGLIGLWFSFGFVLGYVIYDIVHYACHQWPMRGKFIRRLKVHHMQHHFGRTDGNYAITGIAWDHLLATSIQRR